MSSKIALRKTCSVIFVFFLTVAVFTGCRRDTGEDDCVKGWAAYQKENYEEAAKFFKAGAEKGNAVAQYALAICLNRGQGVETDNKQSFEWMRKAAEQGYTKAQFLLGCYYKNGVGVERNPAEAQKWIQKSLDDLKKLAGMGDTEAQNILADYLTNESGVKASNEDPVSPSGPIDAEEQYKLALRYAQGEVSERDLVKSFEWMRKAAEQGHTKAQCLLGIYLKTGLTGKEDPEEAEKWFRKSIGGLQKLAEKGDPEAQSHLAVCYENGFGIEKDEKLAHEWLCKAADQGDVSSQLTLGIKYLNEEDPENAVVWLRKAANQGNPFAQITLGNIFEAGKGSIKPDKAEAVKWFRKAAESGDAISQKAAQDALKRLEAPAED